MQHKLNNNDRINRVIGIFLWLFRNAEQENNIVKISFNSLLGQKLGVRNIRQEVLKRFPFDPHIEHCKGKHSFSILFDKQYVKSFAIKPNEIEEKKICEFQKKQHEKWGTLGNKRIYVEDLQMFSESELGRIYKEIVKVAHTKGITNPELYADAVRLQLKNVSSFTTDSGKREYNCRVQFPGWVKEIVYKDCINYDLKAAFPSTLAGFYNDPTLMDRGDLPFSKFGQTIATMGNQIYPQMIEEEKSEEISELELQHPDVVALSKKLNKSYKQSRIASRLLVEAISEPKYGSVDQITSVNLTLPLFVKEFVEDIKDEVNAILNPNSLSNLSSSNPSLSRCLQNKKDNKNSKLKVKFDQKSFAEVLFLLYSRIETEFLTRLKIACKLSGIDFKLRVHDGCIVDREIPQEVIDTVIASNPIFKFFKLVQKAF